MGSNVSKAFKRVISCGLILSMIFAMLTACVTGSKSYTYTYYIETNPTTWNPHRMINEGESIINSYLTDPLITFSFNEDRSGYKISPSLATALPIDVSASYKGMMGVPASASNSSGYAWRFEIRPEAQWEDDTPINADSFEYSLQQLLNSQMANKHADDFATGHAAIYGANNYRYSDTNTFTPAIVETLDAFAPEAQKVGAMICFDWTVPLPKALTLMFSEEYGQNFITWQDVHAVYPEAFVIKSTEGDNIDLFPKWSEIIKQSQFYDNVLPVLINETGSDQPTYVIMEDTTYNNLKNDMTLLMKKWLTSPESSDKSNYYYGYGDIISSYGGTYSNWVTTLIEDAFINSWTYELFLGVLRIYETYSWANVGFKKISSNKQVFDIIFVNPLKTLFDVAYNFASIPFLVHESLYEETKIVNESTTTVGSKYHTDAATTMSYGPYSLKSQNSKSVHLVKNKKWFGYSNYLYNDQYQTTDIVFQIGLDQSDALNQFLRGKMSQITLSDSDLPTYIDSNYLLSSPDSNTYKLILNSDYDRLKEQQEASLTNVNKIILSYKNFRQAISLSLDRDEYAKKVSPNARTGFGLINDSYISDQSKGLKYRDETLAKLALVAANYPEIGAEYENINSPWNPSNFLANTNAIVSGESYTYSERLNTLYSTMTGRNIEKAKELFIAAFDEAIKNEDYTVGQTVEIDYVSEDLTPSETFKTHAQLLQKYINDALNGTPYDGKVIIATKGSSSNILYSQNVRTGIIDSTVSAMDGDIFSPFTLMKDSYFNSSKRQEYGMNLDVLKDLPLTLRIGGTESTHSMWLWGSSLGGLAEQYINDELPLSKIDNSSASYETKVLISSAVEYSWLSQYCSIPLFYSSESLLVSKQINFGTKEAIPAIGYGGIRYITYNYTDSQWAKQINKSSNLNYLSPA